MAVRNKSLIFPQIDKDTLSIKFQGGSQGPVTQLDPGTPEKDTQTTEGVWKQTGVAH